MADIDYNYKTLTKVVQESSKLVAKINTNAIGELELEVKMNELRDIIGSKTPPPVST